MIDRFPDAGANATVDAQTELASWPVTAPAVHMAHSRVAGPAYERLEECGIAMRSVAPHLGAIDMAVVARGDVVIVGCTDRMLLAPSFRARVQAIAGFARVLAVIPSPSPDSAYLAARAGFHGLVAREVSCDAFRRAIEAARHGELVFPRGAVASLIRLIKRNVKENGGARSHHLTPRQTQVVDLIAQGSTDREIAVVLQISESTAHKHVQNALRRANARTRSQLVARTHRRGSRIAPANGRA
ncbi:MAG: response regulator transcription factor [Actinomycetota bacterium]|nr:response regulator transcription factor [Actinomycetota bacterium]